MAPLHQHQALRSIRASRELCLQIRQAATFDTALYAPSNDLARRLAIPTALHKEGLWRYDFHSLSYAFVAKALKERDALRPKTVVAQLGSGTSLCALADGVSRDCRRGAIKGNGSRRWLSTEPSLRGLAARFAVSGMSTSSDEAMRH